MSLRFIHVVAWISTLLLLNDVWIYHFAFIHSLADGCFGCLYFFGYYGLCSYYYLCTGFKKYILLIMLLQLSHFFLPFILLYLVLPHLPSFPHLFSCPWVIDTSSLTSPFPILFLPSLCLFCTYHLCFLFAVLFPPSTSYPLPADNPPCDLHVCDSVVVLVVCLVCFCFRFSW